MLDKNVEIWIIHMIFLTTIIIYPTKKAQIAFLLAKKIKILSDFSNIFFKKNTLVLLEIIKLN